MLLREYPAETPPCCAEGDAELVPAERLYSVAGEAYFVQYADGEALQDRLLLRKQFTLIWVRRSAHHIEHTVGAWRSEK